MTWSEMDGHFSSDPELFRSLHTEVTSLIVDVIAAVVTFAVLMLYWMVMRRIMTSSVPDKEDQAGLGQRVAQQHFADAVCVV